MIGNLGTVRAYCHRPVNPDVEAADFPPYLYGSVSRVNFDEALNINEMPVLQPSANNFSMPIK